MDTEKLTQHAKRADDKNGDLKPKPKTYEITFIEKLFSDPEIKAVYERLARR